MLPEELWRVTVWWGPGVLIVMVFAYGLLRLAHYWIEKTMEFRRRQMESAFGIARQYVEQFLSTQHAQADALSRLAASVEQHDSRESFEHQEMLIALKALHRNVDELACRRPDLPGLGAARAGL